MVPSAERVISNLETLQFGGERNNDSIEEATAEDHLVFLSFDQIFKKYCGILGSTKIFLCNFAMWQPSIKDDDCSWIDWNLYHKTSCWVLKLKVACPSRKLPQKNRNLPSDVLRIVMPLHGVGI